MAEYVELFSEALRSGARGRTAERDAIAELRRAFPDSVAAKALALSATFRHLSRDEAVRQASGLGDEPSARAVQGEIAAFFGDFDDAESAFESAESIDPSDPFVLRCGQAVYSMLDPERSLSLAKRRVAIDPNDPMAWHGLGTGLFGSHATSEYDRWLEDAPVFYKGGGFWEAQRARGAIRTGNLKFAEECARRGVALVHDSELTWTMLAIVLMAQGRKAEAAEAASAGLAIDPRSFSLFRVREADAAARGDAAEADRLGRAALEAAPGLGFIEPVQASRALLLQSRFDEAVAALAPMEHGHFGARRLYHEIRLRIFLLKGDAGELAAEIDAFEELAPQSALVRRARIRLAVLEGKFEEIYPSLAAEWSLDRPSWIAGSLMECLLSTGRRQEAAALVKDILASPLDSPSAYARAFLPLVRAGMVAENRLLLEAALREFPHSQALRVYEVANLKQAGDVEAANEALARLEPTHRRNIEERLKAVKPPDPPRKPLWRRLFDR